MRKVIEALKQTGILAIALVIMAVYGVGALAAEPAPVWKLVRSNSVQPANYATPDACLTALYAAQVNAGQTVTFRCQTTIARTGVVVPQPVNCAVSAPVWQLGTFGACVNGTQTRTDIGTRTIITQPANGGTACPALTETRTVSQSCTVPPPDPPPTGVGSFVISGASVTLAAPFARWPGYSAATAGPIGNVSGGVNYDDDPRQVNGSNNGVYRETGSFTFTVTAAAGPLTLYVGGWNSAGRLTVTQGGQTVYTHTTAASGSGDAWNGIYTLNLTGTYSVSWLRASGSGNVTIQGASIGGVAPPPPPPTGSASLTWLAPTAFTNNTPIESPITYRVEYGRGDFAQSLGLSGTAVVVDQLGSGVWQFRVRAVVNGAESDPSAVGTKAVP